MCECHLCTRSRRFNEILNYITGEDKEFLEYIYMIIFVVQKKN